MNWSIIDFVPKKKSIRDLNEEMMQELLVNLIETKIENLSPNIRVMKPQGYSLICL